MGEETAKLYQYILYKNYKAILWSKRANWRKTIHCFWKNIFLGSLNENVSLEKKIAEQKTLTRENKFIWNELEFGFENKGAHHPPNMANIKW